jgi:hypothetical protein
MQAGAVGPRILHNYYMGTSHQPSAVSRQPNPPFAEGEKLMAEG